MNGTTNIPAKLWTKISAFCLWGGAVLLYAAVFAAFAVAQELDTAVADALEGAEATAGAILEGPAEEGEVLEEETAAAEEIPVDTAAISFMQKCMGCHTIGGGALTGPDLKPASNWPVNNLRDAVIRMEKQVGPMTPEEVETFTQFILQPEAAERLAAEQKRAAMRQAAQMEPGDATLGEALYMGRRPFRNGGLSCASCHAVGGRGGNLAIPLDDVFARMGETPLISATENPGFPVMRTIYQKTPLTKQEAVHVVKYLEKASENPVQTATFPLHLIGIIGGVGMMVLLGRSTSKRAAGTRARLVAEAHRKSNLGGAGR